MISNQALKSAEKPKIRKVQLRSQRWLRLCRLLWLGVKQSQERVRLRIIVTRRFRPSWRGTETQMLRRLKLLLEERMSKMKRGRNRTLKKRFMIIRRMKVGFLKSTHTKTHAKRKYPSWTRNKNISFFLRTMTSWISKTSTKMIWSKHGLSFSISNQSQWIHKFSKISIPFL